MRKLTFILSLLLCTTSVFAQKELRDSLDAAVKALAFHPDSIDLRLKKASWNVELQQWEYARGEYDYVLKMEPQNIAALYYRAFVLEKLGKYKFARADYESVLAIVPGNYEAQLGLALLNQKDKHYTEALDMLNTLCERHPEHSEVFAARAGVEKERKLYTLAEYDFAKAIAMEPDNTNYRLSRVDVLLLMKRKKEAREELDQLVRMGVSRFALKKLYKQTH